METFLFVSRVNQWLTSFLMTGKLLSPVLLLSHKWQLDKVGLTFSLFVSKYNLHIVKCTHVKHIVEFWQMHALFYLSVFLPSYKTRISALIWFWFLHYSLSGNPREPSLFLFSVLLISHWLKKSYFTKLIHNSDVFLNMVSFYFNIFPM
jgi:hypothetical protein